MDISGSTSLPFPREEVWRRLHDADILRQSVPGCESMQALSPERFVATLVVSVGPVKARLEGDAVISDATPPQSFTLTANGKGGMAGFASAVVTIELGDHEGNTDLQYHVDAKLGGKLAQVGGRLIESTARGFAEEFFERFSQVMSHGGVLPTEERSIDASRPRKLRLWPGSALPMANFWQLRMARKKERASERTAATAPRKVAQAQPPRVIASGYIDIEVGNAVAEVRLNRPEKKNCVSLAMWHELAQAFDDFGADEAVRCVVMTGADGHFSSGADKSEFGEVRSTPEQKRVYEAAVDGASEAILNCPKPVVAAVEGYCVGGGLGLAMACDFRLAIEGSQFFIPATKLSIVYGERATHTLLALVGLSEAKRILYMGERMDAREAKAIGLVDAVAGKDEFKAQVAAFVGKLVEASPRTVSGSKAVLHGLAGLKARRETRPI